MHTPNAVPLGPQIFFSALLDFDQLSSSNEPSASSAWRDTQVTASKQFVLDSCSLQPARRYFAQNSSTKLRIAHPYARLLAKKDDTKRRRIWNHLLEKSIFDPYELSTLGAPHRRMIYIASLEAHIDKLHTQLYDMGCCPVSPAELEPFRGLNSKTAKSMVSNLQHEVSISRLKLLELERANTELECLLRTHEISKKSGDRS